MSTPHTFPFNNALFDLQDQLRDLRYDLHVIGRECDFLEDVVMCAFGTDDYLKSDDEQQAMAARFHLLTEHVVNFRTQIAAAITSKKTNDMHATFIAEGKAALETRRATPGIFETKQSTRLRAVIDGQK
jgi:hypothetical protein